MGAVGKKAKEYQIAWQMALKMKAVLEREGDRAGQAQTWDSLGHAHHHLGHHAEAAACYRHALELVRELGDRFGEAEGFDRIGDVQYDTGDLATARG